MSRLAPLLSSDRMDWQTPESVLELVRRVGEIAIDPCTTEDNPVGAWGFFTPARNGLLAQWDTRGLRGLGDEAPGLVFVNPPYGRKLPEWIGCCVEWARDGVPIIALVPARTDTRWFESAVRSAQALCLWRGRITFRGAPHPAPFPSALFYWGALADAERFRDVFAPHGITITLPYGDRA